MCCGVKPLVTFHVHQVNKKLFNSILIRELSDHKQNPGMKCRCSAAGHYSVIIAFSWQPSSRGCNTRISKEVTNLLLIQANFNFKVSMKSNTSI
uniref:Uncharacterized protein n=1 Tax=Rhizophora mucronata TaxID=61149 RepID=A0A2P2INE3_RHIMU